MQNNIIKSTLEDEYYFQEGCFILEMSNSTADPDVSIARARVEPGKITRWHRLKKTTERYVILEGEGMVFVGDTVGEPVITGDTVIISPDTPQRIKNTGISDLIFLAICSPRFMPEIYEDIEAEMA